MDELPEEEQSKDFVTWDDLARQKLPEPVIGDTSPESIVDFSRYPSIGNIGYQRTVAVPPGVAAAIRAGNAVIVVHGIDYNYNHIYDFPALGVSDLDKTLPGEATAPALCGSLRLSSRTQASADGGAGGRG